MAPTILCLASYFKGGAFLEECKRLGCHTILVTSQDLEQEAWPRAAIDEFFVMPFVNLFKQPDITYAVSYLARTRRLDRIIALDDFDVETVADLREHLRIPGMGGSTARYFRDKLAMRVQARDEGIPAPDFVHVLNYDDLREFMGRVPGPWVLKPRSEASSMGIRKVNHADELWPMLEELGDRQTFYVLEQFVPGDVFHVDSVVWNKQVLFTVCSQYGQPPMAVYQGGGVFISSNLPYHAPEEQALQVLNQEVIAAMGMVRGVTHAEFIRADADGAFYFLEIAARVGGAYLDLMLEHATGLNLWREWARLEMAHLQKEEYVLPATRAIYAGLVVSLAKEAWPDATAYQDPEIVWRLQKEHHVGFIVASPDSARVQQLIAIYAGRIAQDFTATAPPKSGERPA
ncbi:MAG: ATP-grasp domain-containing protein [Caldilineaceae bacterium]|jgi:biotin carboxylase|nr:ATP-grasp domain-containing protein [Caldilineaceae bacterium]